MARLIFNIIIALVAIAGGVYQFYLKPILTVSGYGRVVESIGNMNCIAVPELKACEKVVIHQPTGIVYLACSTPTSRTHWTPAVLRLNASGASRDDYVATYDPKTSRVTRLKPANFDSPRGLSLHGMDVVPSSVDSSELFVYLVNHRAPTGGQLAKEVGADSVVEIFKTKVGSSTLTHVKTVEDSVISTPNDVIGYGNGKSFYVTNDHGVNKIGLIRELDILGRKSTSVGYCHIDHGCKYAITGMHGNNGIAKAANDTIYVGDAGSGGITFLERQNDNSLVITDKVKTDYPLDNLSVDSEGHLWAAGFPDGITLIYKHFADPSVPAPSAALRISINTGPTAFYGDKYKVDKVFEDDGKITSGTTSVVYDVQRKKLYMHGLCSPHLSVCTV